MADLFTWRPCCMALFLLLLFPTSSLQQSDVSRDVYLNCLRNATTSLSSTLTRNLNTTLRNLTTLASQGSLYANITTGSSGEGMVYAFFQCRGDMSRQACGECVQNITARLPQECPASVGARIRVDYCFLRYDNQSFFVLDTTMVYGGCNVVTTSDVATLGAISDLYENVTTEAPEQGGWASATAMGMYAAAQCMAYLSQSDCAACLSTYSDRAMLSMCNDSVGMTLMLSSCDLRYEDSNFLTVPPPSLSASPMPAPAPSLIRTAPLSLPPAPVTPPAGSKNSTPVIVGSVVAGIIVVGGVLCVLLAWRHKRSKTKGLKRVDKAASWPRKLLPNKAQIFSLKELDEATGQFHPDNKLGEGGFGIVYKGTLSNGEQVAIKKLYIGRQQAKQEFLNEVNLITSVQHKNLIKLLGCCVEDPERILVYEYLPNKSLDVALFAHYNSRMLNWSTRYDIVIGMAKGLAYLHEESHIRIIHRDIKPNNILLDDQLNPIIADFGLARLVKDNATHVSTGVAGTIGYLAPEYAIHGALSEKVDVFSFGLVSLEVITGKENLHHKVLSLVWEKYQNENVLDLVDDRLGNAFSSEQVIRVVHIALLCTQENPKQRPTMSMVALWLSGTSAILELPIRPTFLDYNDPTAHAGEFCQFTSTSSTSSQLTNVFGGKVPQFSGGVQSLSEIIEPR